MSCTKYELWHISIKRDVLSYLPQKIDFVITCKNILGENRTDITRLSSIESQPKKVVVIVVVVVVIVVVVVVIVVVVVFVVDPKS